MSPENERQPEIRVSDTERQVVAEVLRRASAEGRLTLAEYDERVAGAYAAKTRADLDTLVEDLPPLPGTSGTTAAPAVPGGAPVPVAAPPGAWPGPPPPAGGVEWTVAVMSGHERRGRWRPAARTRALALMGGCELDLREAFIPAQGLDITAVAVMGGIEIIVSKGVDVEVSGFSFMGGRSVKVDDTPHPPDTPVVRVKAYAVMGGIDVKSKDLRKQLGRQD